MLKRLRLLTLAALLLAFPGACGDQQPSPTTNQQPDTGEDAQDDLDTDEDAQEEPDTDETDTNDTDLPDAEDSEEPDVPEDPRDPVEWEATVVATDLAAPWDLTATPDNRVFLTERDEGRVMEYVDGESRVVREFTVDNAGEGGLLGVTHSPDFENDNLLYVYFTADDDNRIVRFNPDNRAEPELVFEGIPKARIHNGGRIDFGPDGMLYVGTGDAAIPDLAQDADSLAGKILRMTPDGELPDDNPTAGSFVYSMGHRNVQGLAWDSQGRLFATEFGPSENDEVNRIIPGNNYGWPEVTGEVDQEGFTDPIFVQQPRDASWSGLTASVRGAIPQWDDQLLVASLRGQKIWRIELNDEGTEVIDSEALFFGEWGRLRAAVQAADGSIWVLTNNRDGRGDPREGDDHIYRLGPQ